jgi:hypothetical protein
MSYMLAAQPGTRAAETRGMGDWPPLRPSGPEPGSADGPPWPQPYSGFGGITDVVSVKTLAVVGAAAFAAWWLFLRKKPKSNPVYGRRRRRRRRARGRRR